MEKQLQEIANNLEELAYRGEVADTSGIVYALEWIGMEFKRFNDREENK